MNATTEVTFVSYNFSYDSNMLFYYDSRHYPVLLVVVVSAIQYRHNALEAASPLSLYHNPYESTNTGSFYSFSTGTTVQYDEDT